MEVLINPHHAARPELLEVSLTEKMIFFSQKLKYRASNLNSPIKSKKKNFFGDPHFNQKASILMPKFLCELARLQKCVLILERIIYVWVTVFP